MHFLKHHIALLLFVVLLAACNNGPKPLSDSEATLLMKRGDSIASTMQGVLLHNVSTAIQTGGTDYAIEFCSVKAMALTDSVSKALDVYIQRLTDKPRNSANRITTGIDRSAWKKIQSDGGSFVQQNHNGIAYYYQPIMIAMPTCLKCHGGKDDISKSTQQLIAKKYPTDFAQGYVMGDLRGMWKIKMNK